MAPATAPHYDEGEPHFSCAPRTSRLGRNATAMPNGWTFTMAFCFLHSGMLASTGGLRQPARRAVRSCF